MDKEYRYMIYNEVMKEYQFPRICETTEKGATTCLFNMIGNDARKHRFKIKRLEKELAYKIRQELKYKAKANRIHRELENIDYSTIYNLVIKNDKKKTDIENLCNECSTIVKESGIKEVDLDEMIAKSKETQRKADKYDLLVEKIKEMRTKLNLSNLIGYADEITDILAEIEEE